MNIIKTMAVESIEDATRSIPVINVAPAFSGAPGGVDKAARQVRHASERVGCFFISYHRGADHPDVVAGKPLCGRNQWPEGHAWMRRTMGEYFGPFRPLTAS